MVGWARRLAEGFSFPGPSTRLRRRRPDRLQDPGFGNDSPSCWVSPPPRHDCIRSLYSETMTALNRSRLDRLRPLSSATDLTDLTHSTLDPDVCRVGVVPATHDSRAGLTAACSRTLSQMSLQTSNRALASLWLNHTPPRSHVTEKPKVSRRAYGTMYASMAGPTTATWPAVCIPTQALHTTAS